MHIVRGQLKESAMSESLNQPLNDPRRRARTAWRGVWIGMLVVAILFALLVHYAGVVGSVRAVNWLSNHPYDSDGGVHSEWFTVGFLCATYLILLAIGVVLMAYRLARRMFRHGRSESNQEAPASAIGFRMSRLAIFQIGVVLLGIAAYTGSRTGELGLALWVSGENPAWHVTSDAGVVGRAPRMNFLFLERVSDQGMVNLGEHGSHLRRLRMWRCPEVTAKGLASMSNLQQLDWLEVRTEGDAQAAWGDEEATLLTQSPALRKIELMDFTNLTDAWLDGLRIRCPYVYSVEVFGDNKITPEAWARFRRGTTRTLPSNLAGFNRLDDSR